MAGETNSGSSMGTSSPLGVPTLAAGTVLFCDIRGFTRLLGHLSPAAAFEFIEQFLEELTEDITAERGTVSNLTGDGFVAHFSMASAGEHHALFAVNAAISMRSRLRELNRNRHRAQTATISIGVGINTGPLATGKLNVAGREHRVLIGDVVNIAARIESLTKEFSVDILIAGETYASVRSFGTFLAMPPRSVRGRSEKLITYWVPPYAQPVRAVAPPPS